MTERSDIDRWVIGLAYAAGAPDPFACAHRVMRTTDSPDVTTDQGIDAVLAAVTADVRETYARRAPWPPVGNTPCSAPLLDAVIRGERFAATIQAGMRAAYPETAPGTEPPPDTSWVSTTPIRSMEPPPADQSWLETARNRPPLWSRRRRDDDGIAAAVRAGRAAVTARDIRVTHERDEALTALSDARALLQDIRRAADTHAAGPWLGTALRDRLDAATTPGDPDRCVRCGMGSGPEHGTLLRGMPGASSIHLDCSLPTTRSTT